MGRVSLGGLVCLEGWACVGAVFLVVFGRTALFGEEYLGGWARPEVGAGREGPDVFKRFVEPDERANEVMVGFVVCAGEVGEEYVRETGGSAGRRWESPWFVRGAERWRLMPAAPR